MIMIDDGDDDDDGGGGGNDDDNNDNDDRIFECLNNPNPSYQTFELLSSVIVVVVVVAILVGVVLYIVRERVCVWKWVKDQSHWYKLLSLSSLSLSSSPVFMSSVFLLPSSSSLLL